MRDLLKTHRVFRWLALWCLTLFVISCANTLPRPVNQDGLKEMKPAQSLEREKQFLASRPAPIVEKKPPEPPVIDPPSRFYSMTFQNASMGEVLAALTKDSDYNLVVEADIDLTRSITVRLNKVSLNEALDMIVVNGAGYAWSTSEAVLRIQRFTERVYQLDHLDLSRGNYYRNRRRPAWRRGPTAPALQASTRSNRKDRSRALICGLRLSKLWMVLNLLKASCASTAIQGLFTWPTALEG